MGDANKQWQSDDVWRLLRELKHQQPDGDGERRVTTGDATLALSRDSGWSITGASASQEARTMLDQLTPVMAPPGRQCVVAQIAQSLDGRTATARGGGDRISGDIDHQRLHRLRALSDAVVIGSTTALADAPRLTVRSVPGEQPVRVILDRSRRLPPDHPLLVDERAPSLRLAESTRHDDGHGTHAVPGMEPADILSLLAQQGLTRVLLEGGGTTVSRFLEADCLHRLHLVVAPVLIGRGPTGLDLAPVQGMEHARRPPCHQYQLGDDVLFDMDLTPL